MSKHEEEMYDVGYEHGSYKAFEMVLKILKSRWAKLPNGHYRTANEWAKWLESNKQEILKGGE
jgi:hypothetical protein